MTAPTLRQLIQDVILESGPQTADAEPDARTITNALLASPELAAILDLASDASAYLTDLETVHSTSFTLYTDFDTDTSPQIAEAKALLEAWRASRAERPTP